MPEIQGMYQLPSERSINYHNDACKACNNESIFISENGHTHAQEAETRRQSESKEKRTSRASNRIFFFIIVFCLSGLIFYIALSHIYGFEAKNGSFNELFKRHEVVSSDGDERFVLIVFAWKRKASLERLVESLKRSDYAEKSVEIRFNVEFNPSVAVREYLMDLEWNHGPKRIIWRSEPFGLERMVVESWDASNDKEFAFFFEDDVEVHPAYFKFALACMNRSEISNDSSAIGIALTTPRFDEVNLERSVWSPRLVIGENDLLFLFQQPCSWGALYFPWAWRNFLSYHAKRRGTAPFKEEGMQVIPESCVSGWRRSWKKYLMELMVMKGLVMLYPTLPNEESLSVHHREQGEHTGFGAQKQQVFSVSAKIVDYFRVPLAQEKQIDKLFSLLSSEEMIELPLVSFHHFKVDSIEDLKSFGKLVEDNNSQSQQ
jgi:hypothetical protein